jgi:hypothetical protein
MYTAYQPMNIVIPLVYFWYTFYGRSTVTIKNLPVMSLEGEEYTKMVYFPKYSPRVTL